MTSSLATGVARTCSNRVALVRQPGPVRPPALHGLRRLDRAPFASGRRRPGSCLRCTSFTKPATACADAAIDALEDGAHRRRPHHPAVQHAVDADILHVGEAAGAFAGDIDPRDRGADHRERPPTLGRIVGSTLSEKALPASSSS